MIGNDDWGPMLPPDTGTSSRWAIFFLLSMNESVWGVRVENPTVGHCFQVFSTIQGKTKAKHFCNFSSEALQLL